MTKRQLEGLQAIMIDEEIIRIARWDGCFSVAIKGDLFGTGRTLEEAYSDALRYRQVAA